MKKIKFLALAFAAMFIVACGNPAIDAAEEFIDNPTPENLEKVNKAEEKLDGDDLKEYNEWCLEHAKELMTAGFSCGFSNPEYFE